MSSTVLPESRAGNPVDPRLASLTSLVDAADALVAVATILAAAARATVEAFSTPIPDSSRIQGSEGINLGKGPDDVHKSLSSNEGIVHQTVTDAIRASGENHATDQAKPLPKSTGLQRHDPGKPKSEAQPYRLLVDTEADVLLFVCALIDRRQRTICYLPYEPGSLNTFKQLIERITESPVHILTSSGCSERDQSCTDFLENDGSVLLVPESLSPEFEMEGEDSWVIHVGWPSSEAQYAIQRKNHQVQNNIIVAYAGDQSLYPSGDSIVRATEPWPQDGTSFRESASILQPLYEMILSEIPREMKSEVYQNWIRSHGIHGPRHVKAWTPSTLVQHANTYLSGVLLWSGPHTGGDIPLPEVPKGFVSQNDLELAVREGILRVEADSDSPLPSSSPIPRPDTTVTQLDFQHTAGHTYFKIQDFDAIPLMCYISEKYDKVMCFLEGHAALRYYQKLFAKVTGRPVLAPTVNSSQTIEELAFSFLSGASPVTLLLAYTTTNLPAVLKQGVVDCCIYWGIGSTFKQAKKHGPQINCVTTITLLTPLQISWRTGSDDITEHPSASIPLDLTEGSLLTPMRNKMKAALASDSTVVRGLYTNRIYGVGVSPRSWIDAHEVARRANQYAARVLLHGDPSDGRKEFPPIAGRPSVSRTVVEKFQLQPAVDAGSFTVVG